MVIYIIKPGDSLWNIARTYRVSPERLMADNGITNPSALVVGQAILILIPEQVHTVAQGETLSTIAASYNTTVTALLQNNPDLALNPAIYPGQQITISYRNERTRNITVNGYAYTYINRDVLMQTLPYLTTLTIFGYGFTEAGALIPIDDEPLIALARQFRVAPIMLISSITEDGTFSGTRASRLFNDTALQNTLIAQIITTMTQKGYTGLDVDFEYIRPEDNAAYVRFLENVAAQLHAEGFTVHVDLAPKTSATQPGLLYEGHNYREIGRIADSVLLMTYEWGYTYGPLKVWELPQNMQCLNFFTLYNILCASAFAAIFDVKCLRYTI